MKIIITLILSLLSSIFLNAQCRVQTNQRDDGAIIKYMSPDRIGKADKLFMGASMQTNGTEFYVATISIFPNVSENLTGTITIKFTNNKSSILEHVSSQSTTFNGYPATLSIFYADKNDLANINTANISMILLKLESGILQTVAVKMNSDILKKQYNCLK
jgi:hypothetical protein